MKYEFDSIGNIIKVKNVIFENDDKKVIDHAYKGGRPGLIIYTDEEYDYILLFTSQEYHLEPAQTYRLDYNKAKFNNRQIKDHTYVKLDRLYKKRICGHEEIGKVDFEELKLIIKSFKDYQKINNTNKALENAKLLK